MNTTFYPRSILLMQNMYLKRKRFVVWKLLKKANMHRANLFVYHALKEGEKKIEINETAKDFSTQ